MIEKIRNGKNLLLVSGLIAIYILFTLMIASTAELKIVKFGMMVMMVLANVMGIVTLIVRLRSKDFNELCKMSSQIYPISFVLIGLAFSLVQNLIWFKAYTPNFVLSVPLTVMVLVSIYERYRHPLKDAVPE